MIGHLIHFHRRENKPIWWRMFDRCAMTPEELMEDLNCLGGLQLSSENPIAIKQSLVFTYRFDPNQDSKIRAGDRVRLANDSHTQLEVYAFDPEGTVTLKISKKSLEKHLDGRMPRPVSLIPDEYLNPEPIPTAIAEVAAAWKKSGALPGALRRFFLRQPPAIPGQAPGQPLRRPDEDFETAAIRIVTQMIESTLCIQGPPGTGKTTLASRVICELLRLRKNVGVTSNSHKAIWNLFSTCNRLKPGIEGLKVGGCPDDTAACPGIQFINE